MRFPTKLIAVDKEVLTPEREAPTYWLAEIAPVKDAAYALAPMPFKAAAIYCTVKLHYESF